MKPESLYRSPNALAPHYSKFRVAERLLLTGHSHQAWPDCGFEGQTQAWLDAAELVDGKWDRAFAMADRVRAGFAKLLGDPGADVALASNTHDLVIRFLSALPLKSRPRLVTTDGEFHTLRRQLDRLAEEGIEVIKVPHQPAAQVADRLANAVDRRTAAVLASSVSFLNGHVIPDLGRVMDACRRFETELLIDAYHAVNVVPVSLGREGLEGAFVVGGGYKYCELGEGNCFLRIPAGCTLRPVVTGWFSEFETLADEHHGVAYGRGAWRFAGATYDPTSQYRAARVFDFFEAHGLSAELLRQVSQHQIGLLAGRFDGLDADPKVIRRDRSVTIDRLAGFLALETPHAEALCKGLKARGVATDYRGDVLRFGPAPYLSDSQLESAIAALGECIQTL